MAFPTDRTRRSLASALDGAQRQADTLKRIMQDARTSMANGAVTASYVLSPLDTLRGAKIVLTEAAALEGIAAYAQEQLGSSGANVAEEFAAMMSAIDATATWIVTNFPKDANGYLLAATFNGGGARIERTFATADTGQLRTLLDTLIATID